MVESDSTVAACGPSTPTCRCSCAQNGDCEHTWDGQTETRVFPSGGDVISVTCSRCGTNAFDHDLWLGD